MNQSEFETDLRREGYQVIAGEPASYVDGGSLNQFGTARGTPGSQVFPGFRPDNAVDVSRNSKAVYVDTDWIRQVFRSQLDGRTVPGKAGAAHLP